MINERIKVSLDFEHCFGIKQILVNVNSYQQCRRAIVYFHWSLLAPLTCSTLDVYNMVMIPSSASSCSSSSSSSFLCFSFSRYAWYARYLAGSELQNETVERTILNGNRSKNVGLENPVSRTKNENRPLYLYMQITHLIQHDIPLRIVLLLRYLVGCTLPATLPWIHLWYG